MAMFGFVYLWYLMVVLLLEIWLDYRARYRAALADHAPALQRLLYKALTLGLEQRQPGARCASTTGSGYIVTVIGIPSAFLLHGYVGLHLRLHQGQPVVVHAADADRVPVLRDGLGHRRRDAALHGDHAGSRQAPIDMRCVDTIAQYLFYTFVIDFTLEMLDLIHRIYEADESFRSLDFMVHTRLWHLAGRPADPARDAGAAGAAGGRRSCCDSPKRARRAMYADRRAA